MSDGDGGLRIDRVDPEGSRLELLPLRDGDPVFRVTYRSATAIVQPDGAADPPEIRVPMVRRGQGGRGEFAGLMDRLVAATDTRRVRFVGASTPEDAAPLQAMWDAVSPPDARPLYEAVDGFAFETETHEHPSGEPEPCDCLVGEWSP
jgi:hypothetical protein